MPLRDTGGPTIVPLLSSFIIGFITACSVVSPETFFIYMRGREIEVESDPVIDTSVHKQNEEYHKMENSTVADMLYNKVRVLCWVMTNPKNHDKKAKHIKATWGKRCNKLLFMSSAKENTLPTIPLNVSEGRKYLWHKTKEAFKYVYHNHLDDADWFLKADDDTYVILENLRYMLLPHSPNEPVYFGCKFKPYVKQGYMSGGAGYVLSREAVKRLIETAILNSTKCKKANTGVEDVQIGKCLEAVNVKAGDSRDSLKRLRFIPFEPDNLLNSGAPSWFWKYIYYESKLGMDCCSDNAVSFHYIIPARLYSIEYLIYHVRPYGIAYSAEMPLPFQEPYSSTASSHLATPSYH